ncbi:hypothetical protein, partial [Ruegeria arenilitoris]|uniref:hypothetical protein n=1 Tax=Ruegeria arenilitoris TaxID=1173585 RepID=UPI001C2C353F
MPEILPLRMGLQELTSFRKQVPANLITKRRSTVQREQKGRPEGRPSLAHPSGLSLLLQSNCRPPVGKAALLDDFGHDACADGAAAF